MTLQSSRFQVIYRTPEDISIVRPAMSFIDIKQTKYPQEDEKALVSQVLSSSDCALEEPVDYLKKVPVTLIGLIQHSNKSKVIEEARKSSTEVSDEAAQLLQRRVARGSVTY